MDSEKIQEYIVLGLVATLILCVGSFIVLPVVGFQVSGSLGTIATSIVAAFLTALQVKKQDTSK